MKIKEAVNIINSTMTVRAKVDEGVMYVHERLMSDDDWFMRIDLYRFGWSGIRKNFDINLDNDVSPMDLGRVMDVVQRLICTPVNERFPEKKYRLRWIDDGDGGRNYLDNDDDLWSIEDKSCAKQYTESELEQLKKDNPRLAPAIDVMKEPAEDKGNE